MWRMVRRRSLLLTGLGLAGGIGPGCRPAGAGDDPPLRAEIDYAGRLYRFSENGGTDLGDYVDPAGNSSRHAASPAIPACPRMAVLFRRDRGSDRAEVVFELGRTWAAPGQLADLGRYQARIFRGESRLAAVDVPRHYWFSRWRWQSAVRPVRANVAALIASGLLPPLELPAVHVKKRPGDPASYDVMGLAGMYADMGATGDRAEIGPTHGIPGGIRVHGPPGRARHHDGAGGSGRHHPVEHPRREDRRPGGHARLSPDHALQRARGLAVHPDPAEHGHPPDAAHQPALAYLPFVLTGDPYHLETLQFQAAWNILSLPADYRYTIPQVRAHAWSLRTLAQAARVTPQEVPRWLLPRSHWRENLAKQHDWVMATFVTRGEPERAVFRSIQQDAIDRAAGAVPPGTYVQSWQDDYHAIVLAWLVMMGFEEWRDVFRWKIGSTLARTDGQSGWVRAICSPYALMLRRRRTALPARRGGRRGR